MDKKLHDILDKVGGNVVIADSFTKAWSVINDPESEKILCSISGGADSDVVIDICENVDVYKKITYVWFDTGIEYQATKDHLDYLEEKYNTTILREKAIKPIGESCREFGVPFLNKMVSRQIKNLQAYDFKFEDKPYNELCEEYPICNGAIKWWCNKYKQRIYNVASNKYLKEFLIENPPTFKISDECCNYAKKLPSHHLCMREGFDTAITGIRKSEGGIRAFTYDSCFFLDSRGIKRYMPIFWYTLKDRSLYRQIFDLEWSACYTKYGLFRTGCVGCPFERDLDRELDVLWNYEPKLYYVACKVFENSYRYTNAYKEFIKNIS